MQLIETFFIKNQAVKPHKNNEDFIIESQNLMKLFNYQLDNNYHVKITKQATGDEVKIYKKSIFEKIFNK